MRYILICLLALILLQACTYSNEQNLSDECLKQLNANNQATADEIQKCEIISTIERNQSQQNFYASIDKRICFAFILGIGGLVFAAITRYLNWRNYQQSRHSNLNDRYAKAIELLGSEKETIEYEHQFSDRLKLKQTATQEIRGREPSIEIRLGAIYALEDIANESSSQYFKVIEILAAYIRENAPYSAFNNDHKPREDIIAALTVIGRRKLIKDFKTNFIIDLRNINLSGIELNNLNFNNVDFTSSNFNNTYLANLECANAKFSNGTFENAKIENSDFSNTDFLEANLKSIEIKECKFISTSMKYAKLNDTQIYSSNFLSADFWKACLSNSTIEKTNFSSSSFALSDLSNSNFTDVKLGQADLNRANFEHSELHACDFSKSKLRHANFRNSYLHFIDIDGADFYNADLFEANFNESENHTLAVASAKRNT